MVEVERKPRLSIPNQARLRPGRLVSMNPHFKKMSPNRKVLFRNWAVSIGFFPYTGLAQFNVMIW